MNFQTIKYAEADKIATITLARPEKRNAFNVELVNELKNAFSVADKNDSVRVVVLKAEGEVFSAGADLQYLQSLQNNSHEENLADSKNLMELYRQIYLLSKPVIAQIEGHAIAGGCGLATVCDFSVAVHEAQFGYTEVKIGFIPAIVMVFLLRKINEKNARELMLTGKLVNATKAKEIGLINDVVPKREIEQWVKNLSAEIIENTSGESVKLTKQMMAVVPDMSLDDALHYATEMNAQMRSSEDCKRGIQAFIEKRKMNWGG